MIVPQVRAAGRLYRDGIVCSTVTSLARLSQEPMSQISPRIFFCNDSHQADPRLRSRSDWTVLHFVSIALLYLIFCSLNQLARDQKLQVIQVTEI